MSYPAGNTIDRRYYELCVLAELRDRLRAGEVWVAGSRQYRSFEERLISARDAAGIAAGRHPAHRSPSRIPTLSSSSPTARGSWTSG